MKTNQPEPSLREWLMMLQHNHDTKIDDRLANVDAAEIAIKNIFAQDKAQAVAEARLDEARHWDEHIIGSPRKVTVNDAARERLARLTQSEGEKGTNHDE